MYIGTGVELIAGLLLVIVGAYNTIVDICNGSFLAIIWLAMAVVGAWMIDKSGDEFKKIKYEKE